MTTHELARKLLEGPDEPVYVINEDASAPELVDDVELLNREEWTHHHTGQVLMNDADDNPLPEKYALIVGKDGL